MTRKAKQILLGVLITLLVIAVAFVVTGLVMSSIHDVSFVEEIRSWFGAIETVPKVEEGVEAVTNIFRIK